MVVLQGVQSAILLLRTATGSPTFLKYRALLSPLLFRCFALFLLLTNYLSLDTKTEFITFVRYASAARVLIKFLIIWLSGKTSDYKGICLPNHRS